MTTTPGPPRPTVPVPASTLALLRDSSSGLEVCLLRRSDSAGFVAGAHVFTGGSVDPSDHDLGDPPGVVRDLPDTDASRLTGVASGGLAFWMAAVRECFEESGVLLAARADGTPVEPAELLALRPKVHAGDVGLAAALEHLGAVVHGPGIRCISRWITPEMSPRRFDTRFFLAAVPPGMEVVPDGSELVDHMWVPPDAAVEMFTDGVIDLIRPTLETLVALQDFDDAESAVAGIDLGDPAEPSL